MSTKEILDKHGDFLDKAAIAYMQSLIEHKAPQDINESCKLAEVAYRNALALLEVKLTYLEKIIEKDKFFHKIRKEDLIKNEVK